MDSGKLLNGVSSKLRTNGQASVLQLQEGEESDTDSPLSLKDNMISGTAYPTSFNSSKDEYGSQYSSYDSLEQARMNAYYDRINHLGFEQVYPDVDDEMASEKKRFETFIRWPEDFPVKPTDLARAGFYFTGPGDLVSCYSCDLQLKGWAEGDNPFEEHRRQRPNCIYIHETERENYAVTCHGEPVSSEFASGNRPFRPPLFTTRPVTDLNIQYKYNEQNRPVYNISSGNSGQFDPRFQTEYTSYRPYTSIVNPSTTSQQAAVQQQQQPYTPHYRDQNPPVTQESLRYSGQFIPPSGSSLAHYNPRPMYPGYRPTHNPGVTSQNWYPPQHTHPYLQTPAQFNTTIIRPSEPRVPQNSYQQDLNNYRSASVSQESMPPAPNSHPYIRNPDIPVLHPMPHEGSQVRIDDTLHISSQTDLQSEHHRMTTFVDWPEDCPVHPWELASAGFFYLGNHDKVKCYKCGVALRNWEPEDTPWEEHKKWSPHCPLVISHYQGKNAYRPEEDQEQSPRLPPSSQAKKQTYPNPAQLQRSQFQFQGRDQSQVKQAEVQEAQPRFQGYPSAAGVQEPPTHPSYSFSHQGRPQDYPRPFYRGQNGTSLNEYAPNVSQQSPWTRIQEEHPSMNEERNPQLYESAVSTPADQPSAVRNAYNSRQTVLNPSQNPPPTQIPSNTSVSSEGNLNSSDVLRAIEMGFTHSAIDEAIAIKTQRTGNGFAHLDDLMQSLLDNQNNVMSAQQAASTNAADIYSSNSDPEPQVIDRDERNLSQREQNFALAHSVSYHQDQTTGQKQALKRSNSAPPGSSTNSSTLSESVRELERTQEERLICKICMDAEVGIVFLPCGHISCCPNCASGLDLCPMCRMPIQKIHRTFLS